MLVFLARLPPAPSMDLALCSLGLSTGNNSSGEQRRQLEARTSSLNHPNSGFQDGLSMPMTPQKLTNTRPKSSQDLQTTGRDWPASFWTPKVSFTKSRNGSLARTHGRMILATLECTTSLRREQMLTCSSLTRSLTLNEPRWMLRGERRTLGCTP